jgi:hypothetical protein
MNLLPRPNAITVRNCSQWAGIRPAIWRKAFLLAFALAAAWASPCRLHAQSLADDQPASVHGVVVNSITHAPIARALVYSGDNHFAMLTDGEGHFEFALPKPKSDSDSANGNGYQTWTGTNSYQRLWFMARKPGFLEDPIGRMEQLETPQGGELTIPLIPEGLITGRILLSEGDAPTNANVQLFSKQVQQGLPLWVQAGFAQANSSGEFRFADLQAGTYKLVTHELMDNDPAATIPGGQQYGYPPVYFPGVADFAAASTIQLEAGQTVQADLPLARQPYYPVRIPVENAQGSAGLQITVSVQGHRGPGYALGYNAEKQRIEGLLPNGHFLVEAFSFNRGTSGNQGTSGTVRIAVTGAPVDGPGMTLTPNSSVHFNVTEEFTGANPGGTSTFSNGRRTFTLRGPRAYLQARVEAADDFRQTSAMLRQPTTPEDQELVIDGLLPGRYWLRLNSSRGYVASATMGGVDLLHDAMVVSSGSSTPIEIRMRDDTAEIEGTITGLSTDSSSLEAGSAQGLHMPQAYVYCVPLPDGPGQYQELGVSSDGKFSSGGLVPGTYRILAFKTMQQRLPYRDAEAMKPYESMGQVIRLSAGQKATAQIPIILSGEQ